MVFNLCCWLGWLVLVGLCLEVMLVFKVRFGFVCVLVVVAWALFAVWRGVFP